jgi:uncharacterized membrane protein YdjX (TVP38/TMEM64 family)
MQDTQLSWRAVLAAGLGFAVMTLGLTLLMQAIGLENIQRSIETAGPVAPLLYIVVRAATFIAAPLSSGPIQFAAGALFGLAPGLLYSLIGECLGGSANFWISRLLGKPVVQRLVGQAGMARIEKLYQQTGEAWTLAYARLFFFAFYDFVSYAAGFTPVKYRTYLLITALVGILPTGAAVFIGGTLTGDNPGLIVLYAALGVLCVIPLIFYPGVRKWLGKEQEQAGIR